VLLGSVSGAVVRQAECPVVVLPHGAEVADEVAAGLHASSSLA
jgi:hypothetical protein